jgi:hypothetical protein
MNLNLTVLIKLLFKHYHKKELMEFINLVRIHADMGVTTLSLNSNFPYKKTTSVYCTNKLKNKNYSFPY